MRRNKRLDWSWSVGVGAVLWAMSPGQARAQCVSAADFGGADLTITSTTPRLCGGDYRNIGTLTVPAGVTAQLTQGSETRIRARSIRITGTIDGVGDGTSGGAACNQAITSGSNANPGGSGGSGGRQSLAGSQTISTGGGGGGGGSFGQTGGAGGAGLYGGQLGTVPPAPGGIAGALFTLPASSDNGTLVFGQGGGGGGCGDTTVAPYPHQGGAGGGALLLDAKEIVVNGQVLLSGASGGTATNGNNGGGGGGGGGMLVASASEFFSVASTVGLNGGRGGNASITTQGQTVLATGGGGGGGGGGQGRLFTPTSAECNAFLSSGLFNVNEGIAGVGASTASGQPGSKGSISCAAQQQSPTSVRLSSSVVTVQEGDTVTLTGSGTDPNGHLLKYAFDCNGDGTFEVAAKTGATQTCTLGTDGTVVTAVEVSDWNSIGFANGAGVGTVSYGGRVTASVGVTVLNVPPTVNSVTGPSVGNEGQAITLSANVTDPGTGDVAGATYRWSWGDGTADTTGVGLATASHTYTDDSVYTVQLVVTDPSGGASAAYSFTYVANNVSPSAGISFGSGAREATAFNFYATAVADPSTDDVAAGFTYQWDFGDNTGATTTTSTGPVAHTFANSGTYTVSLRVTDKDGGTSTAVTRSIIVANVEPTVALGALPASPAEGSSLTFLASATDVSPADQTGAFTYTWTWGDGTSATTVTGTSAATAATHTFADNKTYTVTVTATDKDGGVSSSASTSVVVANAAPSVTPPASVSAIEGTSASVTVTSTDPGTVDRSSLSYRWDWGDGTTATVTTTTTASHIYADNKAGGYQLTITVTDKDGGSDSATTTVNVANEAPTAVIQTPGSVLEGKAVSFTATATDKSSVDRASLTYAWEFCGGTIRSTDAAPLVTFPENSTCQVRLTISDKDGGSTSSTASFTIANVAPTASIGTLPTGLIEGGTATFTATATDPSAGDTAAGFTYTFNWGDGTTASVSSTASQTGSFAHAYAESGTYTLRVTARDRDGGVSSDAVASVTVANAVPTVSVQVPTGASEGTAAAFVITTTDTPADQAAGFRYEIVWGDGSTEPVVAASANNSPITRTHIYGDQRTYTVTVKSADKDGGIGQSSVSVDVANRPPVVSALRTTPTSLTEGVSGTFAVTVTDPGTSDGPFAYQWSWGDGTAAGTGATPAHTFADSGTYTVSVVATDKDGAASAPLTQTVTVSNAAPVVTIAAPASNPVEGVESPFNVTAADAPQDIARNFALQWDWGDGSAAETSTSSGAAGQTRHTYVNSGSYNLRVTARDADGGTSTVASRTITVSNAAPVVTVTAPSGAREGTSAALALATRDAPADLTAGFEYRIDWGDGSAAETVSRSANNASTSPGHVYRDNGTYTVSVTATDVDGGASTGVTTTITVANVAPVITAFPEPSSTPLTGTAVAFTATATDAGAADAGSLRLRFDWGDSTASTTTASGVLQASHIFQSPGTFAVTVEALDKDGGVSAAVVQQVRVAEPLKPPTVSVSPPFQVVSEGSPAALSATFSDPNLVDSIKSLAWSFGGDTAPTTPTTLTINNPSSPAVQAPVFQDNGRFSIQAVVTDSTNLTSNATAQIQVDNVAPSVAIVPPNGDLREGSPITVLSTATDPSAVDTQAGFAWTLDWGDRTAPDTVARSGGNGQLSRQHKFDDSGEYDVTASATDKDQGVSAPSARRLVVTNVAPSVLVIAPPTSLQGQSVAFAATVTDPSDADTRAGFQISWQWDDGSAPDQGLGLRETTHAFLTTGAHRVVVVVTDKDGGRTEQVVNVQVGNVPPTVNAGSDLSTFRGVTLAFTARVTDPGGAAGLTYRWDFGDTTGSSEPSPTHAYTRIGDFTVRLTVTDADGASVADTLKVTVSNRKPRITTASIAPEQARTGDALTVRYDYTDADSDTERDSDIRWFVNGTEIVDLRGQTSVEPQTVRRGQEWTVTVRPCDGIRLPPDNRCDYGDEVTSFPVRVFNTVPEIDQAAIEPAAPRTGDALRLVYRFKDFDGDREEGTGRTWLRNGVPVDEYQDAATIPAGVVRKGESWQVLVRPSDGQDPRNAQGVDTTREVTVDPVAVANSAPVIGLLTDRVLDPSSPRLVWEVPASDVDGDSLDVRCKIDGGAEVTVFDVVLSAGAHEVRCSASDGADTATGVFAVVVDAGGLLANAGPPQEVEPGRITLTASAAQLSSAPVTFFWSVVRGPQPVVLRDPNAASTTLDAWVPGDYEFRVTVSNGRTQVADTVRVTVLNVAPVVRIRGIPERFINPGESFTLDASASADANGEPLTFRWEQVDGPALEAVSGQDGAVARWTAIESGDVTLRLTVGDGTRTVTREVRVQVTGSSARLHAPVAHAGDDLIGWVNEPVVLSGARTVDLDNDVSRYQWSIESAPGNPQIDDLGARDTFMLPLASGEYVLRLTVTDAAGLRDTDTVVVRVFDPEGNHRPEARIAPPVPVVVGEVAELDGSGSTDADADDVARLSFIWTADKHPVSLVDLGRGRVGVMSSTAGVAEVTLVVSDGRFESDPVTVQVEFREPAGGVPEARAGGDQTVFVGEEVTLDGSASSGPEGATLAYAWSQVDGPDVALQDASTARPRLTPTQPGTYTFALMVSAGVTLSRTPDTVQVQVLGYPSLQGGGGCVSIGGAEASTVVLVAALLAGRRRRRETGRDRRA